MFVDAGRGVGTTACPEREFPALEVTEELLPLLVGRDTVLLARTKCPAPGDEGTVPVDHFFGVDRLVTHGDVEVLMAGDELGDMGRHAVQDRVGDEHPTEVMRRESEWLGVASGDPGPLPGADEQMADRLRGDGTVLGTEAALEQQWHRGQPGAFVFVMGDDEGHRVVLTTDPTDDRTQHVRELRADDEEPFDVSLRGGDVEQWDDLSTVGQSVLDHVVVGECAELFDPDAGVTQDLDSRPCPE